MVYTVLLCIVLHLILVLILYQHNYDAINIDDPEEEGFYFVNSTSMPYTLQYSIKVNCDTIIVETSVFYAKYMIPVQ